MTASDILRAVHIKEHQSHSKTGKVEIVREHDDKRVKHEPLPPISMVGNKAKTLAAGVTFKHGAGNDFVDPRGEPPAGYRHSYSLTKQGGLYVAKSAQFGTEKKFKAPEAAIKYADTAYGRGILPLEKKEKESETEANVFEQAGSGPEYKFLQRRKLKGKTHQEVASKHKAAITSEISKSAGIPESTVSDLIGQWGDDFGTGGSLAIQKQAAEHYGGVFTKFQERQMAGQQSKFSASDVDKFTSAVYQKTQEAFKKDGITHVTLYRGHVGDKELKAGESVDFGLNSLSSWTASAGVARKFADGSMTTADDTLGDKGTVLKVTVPVSQVWSTATTGAGCLEEQEYVLHNGGLPNGELRCKVHESVKSSWQD